MSTGAKDQVGRLLALVPLIRHRGEVHVDEAAAVLGVPPEQLVRDLKVLIYCGWPGWLPGDLIEVDLDAFEPGGDGMIRIANADYLAAPLRLSPAEASALAVALHVLRDSAPADTLPTIETTLAKLERASDPAPVASVLVPARERAVAAVRATVESALADGRQLRLRYHVPARDEDTERVVDPLGLVSHAGAAYLDAWCHRAEDRRSFRLDRVLEAEVLTTAAGDHDLAPLDLSDGVFRPAPDQPLVTLRLGARARWAAEYYPVESVREQQDGALEVDLRVADAAWLRRLLLRLTPDVSVIGPEEFTRMYAEDVSAVRELYGRGVGLPTSPKNPPTR